MSKRVYRHAQRHKHTKKLAQAYGRAVSNHSVLPQNRALLRTITALVADEFSRGGLTPFEVNTYMIQAVTAATTQVAPNEQWLTTTIRQFSRDWRAFYRMAVFYASVAIDKREVHWTANFQRQSASIRQKGKFHDHYV